jgi:hypothetical protein
MLADARFRALMVEITAFDFSDLILFGLSSDNFHLSLAIQKVYTGVNMLSFDLAAF